MKRRISGISLIIALLMVVPTFTVGANGDPEESLVVVKEVFDGEGWDDWIEAEIDDIVQFRITITYYNVTDPENPHYAKNIVVNDTLPPCLEYVEGSAQVSGQPEEPEISNNYLVWDLGDTVLYDGESITITFNASVVDYGENVNKVNVTAREHCTGEELHGYGEATVCVEEPPEPEPLEFEKLVWDPETQEWVEELDEVRKDTPVRFQITVTYLGSDPELMKCMIVEDWLPEECLEYADNEEFIYPNDDLFEDPTITVSNDLKYVKFDWTNKLFNLKRNESVIIRFDANVTEYCECTVLYNCASVDIWGCNDEGCTHYYGRDCAAVNCVPPDPIFNKKVLNGNEWVESTSAFVGDTVRFKIELTYYGNDNLSDIKIVDELPCILEYADNANIKESNVSEDKKTIWWNLTNEELNDGETLKIEFDALVTGVSDCEDCGRNVATYNASKCVTQTEYTGEDDAKVTSAHRPPVLPPVELDICIKRLGLGRVRASIRNVGEEDVSDVEWTITVKGGILKRLNVDVGSTIDLIEAGKSAGICTGYKSILRKFGRITITVTAIVGEDIFEKTACGFVFGRIILVRPLIRF